MNGPANEMLHGVWSCESGRSKVNRIHNRPACDHEFTANHAFSWSPQVATLAGRTEFIRKMGRDSWVAEALTEQGRVHQIAATKLLATGHQNSDGFDGVFETRSPLRKELAEYLRHMPPRWVEPPNGEPAV